MTVIPIKQPTVAEVEAELERLEADKAKAEETLAAAKLERRGDRGNAKLRDKVHAARDALEDLTEDIEDAREELAAAKERAEQARRSELRKRMIEIEATLQPAQIKAERAPGAQAEADALVVLAQVRSARFEVERDIRDRREQLTRLQCELNGNELPTRYNMPQMPSIHDVADALKSGAYELTERELTELRELINMFSPSADIRKAVAS